jgi:hypothetical protein
MALKVLLVATLATSTIAAVTLGAWCRAWYRLTTVRSSDGTTGATHLRLWDTPPPKFGAVAFTFVNAALTLLTHVSIALRHFSLTLLTALVYVVGTLLTLVNVAN